MEQPLKLGTSWQAAKEKIKEVKPELTDADLDYVPGKENELLGRLAKKLNRTPEEVRGWVESVSENKAKAG